MLRPLSIFEKGLLILSVPVIAQAVFIAIALSSLSEHALAQKWAVHTKEVIAKTEETYRLLLERYAAVRNLVVRGAHARRSRRR